MSRSRVPRGERRWGLDRFLRDGPRRGERLGWLANGAAVTQGELVWGPSAALARGFRVVQLFGPEHGPHGAIRAGQRVEDHRDPWTGLPVCSLYGSGPANLGEALARCDTVVVDMVELAARYSTNLALATDLLDAVASMGRHRFVVLDRPNVLGRATEGPRLGPGVRSIVGRLDVPVRHGLTMGELLRWYAHSAGLDIGLDVVRVAGYDMEGVAQDRPFLSPSPNLNTIEAQLLYPGTCLAEGTNLSEGRGTAFPFQVVGAPWLDARTVAEELRGDQWEGVAPRPVRFVPNTSKHQGEVCEGVFLHVVDPDRMRPVALAVRLLLLVFARHEEAAVLPAGPERQLRFIDLLWGATDLGDCLEERRQPSPAEAPVGFAREVAPDLLYEGPLVPW
ncbi:MAG TPA: DUF1343 domain-containing protein [Acidimicrobiales bacterium]|nr:DUF1343 domain-containing protein [Acidimicrobiales bacterium]